MVSDGSVQLIKDIKKSQDPTNVFGVANNVLAIETSKEKKQFN